MAKTNLVNCLSNEKVEVRYILKNSGLVKDPKSSLGGGLADSGHITLTVPLLNNGTFVNVLTDDEKAYLEYVLHMQENALSVYKKTDNYWENFSVRLGKYTEILDLSDPEDYIKYKVLLANKDLVAPSIRALHDIPKVTYRYVLVREEEETKRTVSKVDTTMQATLLLSKIIEDEAALRFLIESADGRPVSKTTKLEYLKEKALEAIKLNPSIIAEVLGDKYFNTKVFLRSCVEAGVLRIRNNTYLLENGTPLCEDNEEATLSTAAEFINQPERQELKLELQAKLKAVRK